MFFRSIQWQSAGTAPTTVQEPNSKFHLPALDGLRAISILIVLVAHVTHIAIIPGGFGVTIFFFISGLLITTLLFNEMAAKNTISLQSFYIRRVLRLLPPLVMTLGLGVMLVHLGLSAGTINAPVLLAQLLFYFNYWIVYVSPIQGITGTASLWSLAVEEHFYLIWPIAFVFLRRLPSPIQKITIFLTFFLVWRYVCYFNVGRDEYEIYSLSDTRMDSILYGCLLAFMNTSGYSKRIFQEGSTKYFWIALSFSALILCFIIRDSLFRSTLKYTIQGMALIPIFYYIVFDSLRTISNFLEKRLLRLIGVYSYVIYLSHGIFLSFFKTQGLTDKYVLLFCVMGSTVIWAALIHKFVELPLKMLRSKMIE